MAHLQERAEWRCVLEGPMAQYVMTSGTVWMPKLFADNWDSMTLVREHMFRLSKQLNVSSNTDLNPCIVHLIEPN